MKVISSIYKEKKNAAPKAPSDIDRILKKEYGAKTISIIRNRIYKYRVLFHFLLNKFYKEPLVLQYPLILKSELYNILPHDKTIILIHDLVGLRNKNDEILKKEIAILKKFKYIIAHNNKMKDFLIMNGIDKNCIFCLEIFDYLADGNINENRKISSIPQIIYPGNLKKEKSPFLFQLESKKMSYILNVYGLGINENINDKVIYKGSFEPDQIEKLEGDLGLIWDGDWNENDEDNIFKAYTKYNNPHKLSCCLAIGVPVIVWRKSAIADFVIKNNVGYVINNLYDINHLDFSDYDEKRKNAVKIGKKLREGFYTRNIFEIIMNRIRGKKID